MAKMINYGVDLGTTNSLIAKFDKGSVEVFKNPDGSKETLLSIVGFRNDRILVGDRARTFMEKDPKNVFGRFKRKMGTTESFKVESLGQSKTPIELSAFVLKELKTFVHTGETVDAIVLTVPASFDMTQSNATKEAGYAAGFKYVILLQEPIAASLAYANKEKNIDLKNSQWIVYDLGGGTFDVALVKIVEGELKVIDHEGNNYLGGMDFDELIVEKLIVPVLEKKGAFINLLAQMKSASGRYNQLWYRLLHEAEKAKIELSTKKSSEIDLSLTNITDEAGKVIDDIIPITRSEFEGLIKESIDATAEMMKTIITRNALQPQDLKFVLMVGGSIYIPFVRSRIEELMLISVNTGIDPINAIVVGAAYYAATKEVVIENKDGAKKSIASVHIKTSYNKATKELEEMFSAKAEGAIDNLFYRITRADGGFDSGLKKLTARIAEDLTLQPETYNTFFFRIFDQKNNPVSSDVDMIQIAQGITPPHGQPLPQDLSLVVDDLNRHDAKLIRLFSRNTILPTKSPTITVDAIKTVVHDTDDEIKIIVVEGSSDNHFSANKKVGELRILGKNLKKDILKGTGIDLIFELSESQDLKVSAYINPSGPEYSQIFSPTKTEVDVKLLGEEMGELQKKIENEKKEAIENENYEVADRMEKLKNDIKPLVFDSLLLALDDVTDKRGKLEEQKRKIAQDFYNLTSGKHLEKIRNEYRSLKQEVCVTVEKSGNDLELKQFNEIVSREHTFLVSSNTNKIEEAINELRNIHFQILGRTPDWLVGWFKYLLNKREIFNDQLQANKFIEAGKRYIQEEDFEKLRDVNLRLNSLLPQKEQDTKETKYFTGIA
ncbi:MAG: Hsp70 family protein [Elusimicrobiota bacterium]